LCFPCNCLTSIPFFSVRSNNVTHPTASPFPHTPLFRSRCRPPRGRASRHLGPRRLAPADRQSDRAAPRLARGAPAEEQPDLIAGDRKSTRLHSSHVTFTHAVCCLTKK